MKLHELIIKAHARAHAAELAVQAKRPDCAYDELDKLRILLTEELIPMERPKCESSESSCS
ncbi:unnamed protein product [marine sediment metagenome]|uniref:Uncharacterized protein n=1 Tax=marine sediment metagenome TaxID=412755 RepID=X1DWN6_9ZZZZ